MFFYNFSIIKNIASIFYWNHFYESKDYLAAQKEYISIWNSKSSGIQRDAFYNLGNSLYRMGEKEDGESRIRYWKESIFSYKKSLVIEDRSMVRENLAYVEWKLEDYTREVKKKIEDAQKQDQKEGGQDTASWSTQTGEKSQENTQTGSSSLSNAETSSGSWMEKKPDLKNEKTWSNSGTYESTWWEKHDSLDKQLSPDELLEVKKYMESISLFQKDNSWLFQPKEKKAPWDISQEFKNLFGNDSFFEEMIPKDERKKDW